MTGPETEPKSASDEKSTASNEQDESRRKKIVATCFFLAIIILWLLVHFLNGALTAKGAAGAGYPRFAVVEIARGSDAGDIATELLAKDVITNGFLFTITALARRSTRDLKAGEYRFETSMSLLDVLRQLERGSVMLHEFTIPEGYTISQIADRLEESGLADAQELLRLAKDPELCHTLGIKSHTLEGFLFPDTYRVAKGLSAEELLGIMVDKMWSVWGEEIAGHTGEPDILEIINIASIIEKEAIFDDEKPKIASVIYNRLEKNIALQCDVTIRYPLDNYGTHLTHDDLKMESPYNSYLHTGIPPTPICSPGLPAIRAALNPAQTDYMYFVSMNNGRHKFSPTLNEHNKAVYRYQILNERG